MLPEVGITGLIVILIVALLVFGPKRLPEIGRSLGLEYNDNEELKGADKVEARDRHRWELDPASSEDYDERD